MEKSETTPNRGDSDTHVENPITPVETSSAAANPAPLGLAAFGISTFALSLNNVVFGIGYHGPKQVVIGLAIFHGGVVQLLAGMWEFKAGNTFGATAFTSYGAFWLSLATLFLPVFDLPSAYAGRDHELNEALGIYFLAWALFSAMMFACVLRQSVAAILLFGALTITFLLLSMGRLSPQYAKLDTQAGGYSGILTAIVALYMALANLATKENTYFTLPLGKIRDIEYLINYSIEV